MARVAWVAGLAEQVVLDGRATTSSRWEAPLALAAFDTGVALSDAKTLQGAGYTGLHTLVRGNDGVKRILNVVEKAARQPGVFCATRRTRRVVCGSQSDTPSVSSNRRMRKVEKARSNSAGSMSTGRR